MVTENDQKQLGKTLWNIADQLRGSMNADDFRDYMLSFLFLRYLSDNYEAAAKKELGSDYPDPKAVGNAGKTSLSVWYAENSTDVTAFAMQRSGVRSSSAPPSNHPTRSRKSLEIYVQQGFRPFHSPAPSRLIH